MEYKEKFYNLQNIFISDSEIEGKKQNLILNKDNERKKRKYHAFSLGNRKINSAYSRS